MFKMPVSFVHFLLTLPLFTSDGCQIHGCMLPVNIQTNNGNLRSQQQNLVIFSIIWVSLVNVDLSSKIEFCIYLWCLATYRVWWKVSWDPETVGVFNSDKNLSFFLVWRRGGLFPSVTSEDGKMLKIKILAELTANHGLW